MQNPPFPLRLLLFRSMYCKFVSVVDIVEDAIYWGLNHHEDFKRVEVVEQTGWWMERSEIILKPNQDTYENVEIGDKLCIKFNQWTGQEICEVVSKYEFEECPNCLAVKDSSEHTCLPREGAIKIEGCGKVLALLKKIGSSKAELLIEQGDQHFIHKSILPSDFKFKKGEIVSISGWRHGTSELEKYVLTVDKIE